MRLVPSVRLIVGLDDAVITEIMREERIKVDSGELLPMQTSSARYWYNDRFLFHVMRRLVATIKVQVRATNCELRRIGLRISSVHHSTPLFVCHRFLARCLVVDTLRDGLSVAFLLSDGGMLNCAKINCSNLIF